MFLNIPKPWFTPNVGGIWCVLIRKHFDIGMLFCDGGDAIGTLMLEANYFLFLGSHLSFI